MASKQPSRVALQHLRSWRAYKGLTLDALGEAADLTKTALSRLENGQARANPITVFKLAKALGITRKQLVEQEPDEAIQPADGQEDHEQTEEDKKDGRAAA